MMTYEQRKMMTFYSDDVTKYAKSFKSACTRERKMPTRRHPGDMAEARLIHAARLAARVALNILGREK